MSEVISISSIAQKTALEPIKAGTHFTDPEGMEGWVNPLAVAGFWTSDHRNTEKIPAP